MAWVDLVSDTNTYGHIWSAETVTNEWYNADWIGTDSDGTTLRWGAAISATETSVTGGSLSTDTPAHVCLVRSSATSLSAYLNGASAGSASTQDIAGRASTVSESLGNLSTYHCPVRLTAIKQWQAALTADEISAEMHSIRPLRLANLHSWHPAIANTLTDALKDCSGNGRDWTSQGTNTVETQSAPVSWGAQPLFINPIIVTAQYVRPTSDVSAGTWTASSGSDLYAMLDETSASDADYIVTTGASTCEVALGSLTDPASSSGHIVRYRISATSGGITVRLRQGTTTVATWVHAPAPTSLTTYAQTLTSGEADSITDYTALRLQFEATT